MLVYNRPKSEYLSVMVFEQAVTSMMETRTRRLLDSLAASLPGATPDPWQDIREALGDPGSCLERADEKGFWVHDGECTRRVEFPGGLTERHYRLFSMSLTDDEKAVLAMGVIKNRMRPICPEDWNIIESLLLKKSDATINGQGARLPALVQSKGFQAIAEEMKQELKEYKKRTPRRRLRIVVVEKPSWDGRVLSFGGKTWKFRRDNGPVNQLLDELEQTKWQFPVRLPSLHSDQVREAGRLLRRKTRPLINWHAGSDGEFTWSLP